MKGVVRTVVVLGLVALAVGKIARNSADVAVDENDEKASRQIPYILMEAEWNQLKADINTFWLLIMATLVFMMQAGFTLLEAGCIRSKNIVNLLFKNFMDVCMGAFAFYLIGFGFAFGIEGNSFIGAEFFALHEVDYGYNEDATFASWFFQFTFAATAATIASGSMAERTQITAYMIFTFVTISFTYPVVVHWVWSGTGWLGAFNDDPLISDFGYIDFAGGVVVHVTGGLSGLVGTLCLGPRLGRFDNDGPKPQGHNIVFVAQGTILLWFGWYGFNPGSTLQATDFGAQVASLCAVTTTLSCIFACLTALFMTTVIDRKMDLALVLNGALAGLVSITAGCAVVDTWAAVIAGIIGGGIYYGSSKLLLLLKVDDPIDAFAVHGLNGMWGAFFIGLFASESRTLAAYPNRIVPGKTSYDHGLFMGGGGRQLAVQIVGIVTITAWVAFLTASMFIPLKFAKLLRVPLEEERMGLDESKHGGHAYPEHSLIMRTLASRLLAQDKN